MRGARLRSTAGFGLAPLICCLTVRKKTGVGGGSRELPLIRSLERFCSLKKAPLPIYRRTSSFDFANGVRSEAKGEGSLPKAGLNEHGFLEKHESPYQLVDTAIRC
jgi:hypothetical protein